MKRTPEISRERAMLCTGAMRSAILSGLVLLSLGLFLGACSRRQAGAKDVILSLEVQARSGRGWVDLAQAAPFEWDRVAIFEPYTSPEQVREMLGFDWNSAAVERLALHDDQVLLVFCREGSVVAEIPLPARAIDFQGNVVRHVYERAAARFAVRRDRQGRTVLRSLDVRQARSDEGTRSRP